MGISRIPQFIEAVKVSDKVLAVCQQELDYLRDAYDSLQSFKRAVSRYRNRFKAELEGELLSTVLSAFRLTDSESKALQKIDRDSIAKDQLSQGQRRIDGDALINRAEQLLEANGYLKVCLGLCLLTGRRPVELLRSGKFHQANQVPQAIETALKTAKESNRQYLRVSTPDDVRNFVQTLGTDDYILFSGQAKQADSDSSALQPFPIPTLCNSVKVLKAIQKLREMKPEFQTLQLTAEQVEAGKTVNDILHSKTNKSLNDKVSGAKHPKVFGDIVPLEKCSAKGLRAAYAEICYAFNQPDESVGKSIYFSRILGHTENATATSQSYMDFIVK